MGLLKKCEKKKLERKKITVFFIPLQYVQLKCTLNVPLRPNNFSHFQALKKKERDRVEKAKAIYEGKKEELETRVEKNVSIDLKVELGPLVNLLFSFSSV